MTHVIRISRTGDPEVLEWIEADPGNPATGQVRVRNLAIGVNFIDCYHRSGLYSLPLPAGLGMEAAGVVESVGAQVEELRAGDRVATIGPPPGSYAEARLMPAERVVKIPDGLDESLVAAGIFKGLTAHYLIFRTFPVKRGDTILLHAAAGGVGQIMSQWANHLGATVIGTVGSEAKAEIARSRGCHHVINYNRENFAERVREITNGRGVDVVYDSVGKATFEGSIDSLRPMGLLASFGNASGPVLPFDPLMLMRKGSLFFTRASLMDYAKRREDLLAGTNAVLDALGKGIVKVEIGQSYALRDAAQAHRDLEARRTTGSSLLLP